ncbi:serine/threonine-protein kinase [Actinomadura flavalba]|uniref:serine/threonine-protein kinase n=1 Tax=Actinomadura flavalba TaxID=1120938 RepID=UPI00037306F4|nr:serine/threonine-protein kinase [Actinomadura flavalba]
MPDAAPLEPGDPRALGQYEVVGRLGAGGQGAVFLGRVRGGGDYVAIKLLHAQMASDPSARARFTREVAAAQKVEPFCTARVLEADVHGDQPYVVSEFIDGPSLHDLIARQGPFGLQDLERLAIGTVTALAAIHEAGIVHRDFKPNNVMLASDGPRVVDFGIARTVNSQESAVTATGMVVGTPGYLAPEQLTGAPLTPAVDIFAWGATMVFAATGQSPFEAETLPVIINKILNEEPDLSALPAGPLRDVIARCLSKDAGLRPPAAQLLLNLLDAAGAAPAGSADSEDLLNQGTRIASQLPSPPPVRQRPHTPPPQPLTPPPMPLHQAQQAAHQQGPPQYQPQQFHTPPPRAVTPPPMPMYQGGPGPQHTPPPMHTAPPGPYGPPPQQRSGSNTGLIVGIGCGAVLLVGILLIVMFAVLASGDDEPEIPTSLPSSYSAPAIPGPTFTSSRGGLLGTFRGTGNQPGAVASARVFEPSFFLLGRSGTASYRYPTTEHRTCVTRLTLLSEDDGRFVYREEAISTGSDCASGYVTFIPSGGGLRWEWRQNSAGTGSAEAYGQVSKQ